MINLHCFDSKNIYQLGDDFKKQVQFLDLSLEEQHWNKSIWNETWLEFNNFYLYFFEEKGLILAFSLWTCPPQEETMHLLKIVVRTEQRNMGLGKKLMEKVIELNPIKGIYLEVLAKNTVAVAFYQSMGLKIMTRTRDYYGDGLDAYKMYRPTLLST